MSFWGASRAAPCLASKVRKDMWVSLPRGGNQRSAVLLPHMTVGHNVQAGSKNDDARETAPPLGALPVLTKPQIQLSSPTSGILQTAHHSNSRESNSLFYYPGYLHT